MRPYISKIYGTIKKITIKVLKFFNPFDIIKFEDDITLIDEYRILTEMPNLDDFIN